MNAQDQKQKATLPPVERMNAKWRDTPVCKTAVVVAYDKGQFFEPVVVRWFQSPRADGMARLYCTIWASNHHHSYGGHGYASGCGYHKPSAALSEAIRSAGITLALPLDGRGDGAMKDALLAIAAALGFRKCHVVTP